MEPQLQPAAPSEPTLPPAPQPTPVPQSAPAPSQPGLFSGRVGRMGYLLGLLYPLGFLVVLIVVAILISLAQGGLSAGPSPITAVLNTLIYLLGAVFTLALIPLTLGVHVRRWHDLGKSGFFVLLAFVPFVGFVAALVLLFKAGTAGSNQYGEPRSGQLDPLHVYGLR